MSELAGRKFFFTEDEFDLCLAAAGIGGLCRFAGPPRPAPSPGALMETVFSLTRRGLLARRGEGFAVDGEPGECFRLMGASGTVIFVFRREYDIPICLLFGGADGFVSMQPGSRTGEYAGLALYRWGEAEEWIADAGLALPGNIPDDLLAAVREDDLEPLSGGAAAFLQRNAWPQDREPGAAREELPEDIPGCLESRRAGDGLLLGRAYLVRQPLFDRLVVGNADGVSERLYRTETLARIVRAMLDENPGNNTGNNTGEKPGNNPGEKPEKGEI